MREHSVNLRTLSIKKWESDVKPDSPLVPEDSSGHLIKQFFSPHDESCRTAGKSVNASIAPLFVFRLLRQIIQVRKSPLAHGGQQGRQRFSVLRQRIFNPGRNFRIHLTMNQTLLLQLPQLCSQHSLPHFRDQPAQLPEPLLPFIQQDK